MAQESSMFEKVFGVAKNYGSIAFDHARDPHKMVPPSLATAMGKSTFLGTAGKAAAEAMGVVYGGGIGNYGQNEGFLGARNFTDASKGRFYKGIATAGGLFSAYYTASSVLEGYDQGGLSGAALGFAQATAEGFVGRKIFGYVMSSVSAGATAASAGRAGVLKYALGTGGGVLGFARAFLHPASLALMGGMYALNQAGEYIQETDKAIARRKQVRGLELGGPIQDQFGTISTLRQRSLMALQNTHVNGRMAFGQEAALLHSTF